MAGHIDCPAPLPEGPADALLAKMLTPTPYTVPEKTKKAKGTRKSSRRQASSDSPSNDSAAHSSPEDEEEEEDAPPLAGGDKKRKATPTGGPKGPRREGLSFRTVPPLPTKAKTSGCPGPSPRGDRKYSDTKVTHRIPLSHYFS